MNSINAVACFALGTSAIGALFFAYITVVMFIAEQVQ